MASSVDTLEAVFKAADCKLDSILHQLEDRFAEFDSKQAMEAGSDERIVMNPVRIIDALREIQQELATIQQERKELMAQKEELTKRFQQECISLRQDISEASQMITR